MPPAALENRLGEDASSRSTEPQRDEDASQSTDSEPIRHNQDRSQSIEPRTIQYGHQNPRQRPEGDTTQHDQNHSPYIEPQTISLDQDASQYIDQETMSYDPNFPLFGMDLLSEHATAALNSNDYPSPSLCFGNRLQTASPLAVSATETISSSELSVSSIAEVHLTDVMRADL